MADYLPSSDGALATWVDNFLIYANVHLADLGLVSADMMPITNAGMDFSTKLASHAAVQQTAQAARQAKDDSRDNLEAAVRALVRRLQASPSVDDAERVALGITVRDSIQTQNVGGISTRPIGSVDTSQRLRHEIRFADEATPTRKAKPAGIMGCEIWVKVAAPGEAAPTGPDGLSFVAMDTASPYVAEYDGSHGGKTAHYMLRWVKSSGEKGPWSETLSATIAG